LLLFNLLDGSDAVIRINNFLADFEAHCSTSIGFENQTAPHARVWGKSERRSKAPGP
jgi:hypothetical protein